MGTTLTGTTPQDTYDSLIKVTDNGPLTGSLKKLTDGLGNDSSLSLSTTAASLSGTLAVSGNATFDTNTLFVDAANNRVGFGTITPDSKVRIQNDNASVPSLTIRDGGTPTVDHIRVSSGTYGDAFFVGAIGNVGIGTSAPTADAKLHVVRASSGITARTDLGGTIIAEGSTRSGLYILTSGTDVGSYGSIWWGNGHTNTDASIQVNNSTRAMSFAVADAERFRITPNGVTFNGDTAAANALDDYEEGTWTMGVSFGGASVGVAYGLNGGLYTKIGRQVTVSGFLSLSSKGSSTGSAFITGLPFTIANNLGAYTAASLSYITAITFANQISAYGDINTTTLALTETLATGTRTAITDADFANNSEVMLSFTYFV